MKQSIGRCRVSGMGLGILIFMILWAGIATWSPHKKLEASAKDQQDAVPLAAATGAAHGGQPDSSQHSPPQTTQTQVDKGMTPRIVTTKSLEVVNSQKMQRIQKRMAEIEAQTQKLGFPQSWAKKQLSPAESDQLLKLVIELEALESALLDLKLKALSLSSN